MAGSSINNATMMRENDDLLAIVSTSTTKSKWYCNFDCDWLCAGGRGTPGGEAPKSSQQARPAPEQQSFL